jgi:hypothetical protein
MNTQTRRKIRWNFNGTFTRLREGDLVKYDNQTVRVERVTPTAAYVALPREARSFTTLMGQTVTLKPSARRVAISANSEIPILNRRAA